jgi:hemerythrin superfamily protein
MHQQAPARSTQALAVLAADHKLVGQLLAEFDELAADRADAEERDALARQICDALTAHATAEEEVFYPAAQAVLDDDDLIDDALCEHDSVRALVEHLRTLDARDERFDALVLMLSRAVAAHVRREEEELFPRVAAATGLDLEALGAQIIRRRDEALLLLAEDAA